MAINWISIRSRSVSFRLLLQISAALLGARAAAAADLLPGPAWQRHTIDDTSRGADGVRFADVNGDGRMDIATGWEEGGSIRIYLHPGAEKARDPWPRAEIAKVRSPEDAVFADADGDGSADVLSCCEGNQRAIFIHWAPNDAARRLDPRAWATEAIPAAEGKAMWMFALPVERGGAPEFLAGAKGAGAGVFRLAPGGDPRAVESWALEQIYRGGWIMSLEPADLDGDGDADVVCSDRKGDSPGVLWFENRGADGWSTHRLGAGDGEEVMFLDVADLNGDGREDIVAAIKPAAILALIHPGDLSMPWAQRRIELPAKAVGHAKAVRAGDLDGDGIQDLAFSCEGAAPPRSGVVWLRFGEGGPENGAFEVRDLSGPEGVKFDHLQIADADGDGDLDVFCCEERANLGVFWYENPAR